MFHARQPPQDGKGLDGAGVAQRELSNQCRQHVGMGGGNFVKEADVNVDGREKGAERHDAQEASTFAVSMRTRGVSFSFGISKNQSVRLLTEPYTVRANAPSERVPS